VIRGCLFRVALLACTLGACQRVEDSPPAQQSTPSSGQVQRFAFGTTQGEEINSDNMRGNVTVLLFVTTFDLASQVTAKRLEQMWRAHRPQIHAAAVVMEAAKYAPLADVFRTSLELSYPVAIADLQTVQQSSTFGEILSVPTALVLDARGREVLRKSGTFTVSELQTWIARAERQ
jgi:hypothetical protein